MALYKDMTPAQLDEAIYNLRTSIHNAAQVRSAKNMNWMLRQLDIAVAVRRKQAAAAAAADQGCCAYDRGEAGFASACKACQAGYGDEGCEGHESTAGPIGNVVYCDGTCR